MDVNLWLVTGWRGSGKTAFCREMLRIASQSGWDTAGLLSPAEFRAGNKEAIWAQDIRSGEKRLLAHVHSQSELDLSFGDWFFNRGTLLWGNQVLLKSIPCDLLVIDELGPLEFNLSLGWLSALDVIRSAQYQLALVVVRPELMEQAQKLFHPAQRIEIPGVEEVEHLALRYSRHLDRKQKLKRIFFSKAKHK